MVKFLFFIISSDFPDETNPLEDLQMLERIVLRDSVRETLSKNRGMETIEEEMDLAFNNLTYDTFALSENSKELNYYENVNTKHQNTSDGTYENVQPEYENQLIGNQHYENFPNAVETAKVPQTDQDYENYDFGESGIYQNILYKREKEFSSVPDLVTQVQAFKSSVHEVNRMITQSNSLTQVNTVPPKIYQTRLNIQLKLPNEKLENNSVDKEQSIKDNDCTTLSTKPLISSKPKNLLFRKWALGKTEPPKIDLSQWKTKEKTDSTSTGFFSEKEKEAVKQFLEDVKLDLNKV